VVFLAILVPFLLAILQTYSERTLYRRKVLHLWKTAPVIFIEEEIYETALHASGVQWKAVAIYRKYHCGHEDTKYCVSTCVGVVSGIVK
jgi:hypothetical protein